MNKTEKKAARLMSAALCAMLLSSSALAAYGNTRINENPTVVPIAAKFFDSGFIDVPNTAFYKDAVDWAVQNGITSGTGNNCFAPSDTCTRAQAVTFLWRNAGSPIANKANTFIDVSADDYFYNAVLWASENGVTSGATANTFEPNEFVSRAQVVCFLYRYMGNPHTSTENLFSDVYSTDYYADAVRWAVACGIASGTSTQTFAPNTLCNRGELVTFLYRNSDQYAAPTGEDAVEDPKLTETQTKEELSAPDIDGTKSALINGFMKMEESIDISEYNIESLAALDLAVEISDLYNENLYYIATFSPSPGVVGEKAMSLEVQYQCTLEEALRRKEEIAKQSAEVDKIISSVIKEGMTEYDIAKELHDYIVLNTAYDKRYHSGKMPHVSYTAYGALVNGVAVCQGYALAYQELLTRCGIESEYVIGTAGGESHGWNVVKIDGDWYHVDTTWDDPTPDRKGYVRYKYFLKSDSIMSRDHRNWKSDRNCVSTKYDNLEILSPEEEIQKQKDEEEQAKKDKITAEILEYCYAEMKKFPYRTEEELQAAEVIELGDIINYIYFSVDEYDFTAMYTAWLKLQSEMNTINPDYLLNGFSSQPKKDGKWCFTITREDVRREYERRQGIQQQQE